jgi:hypothetical protein
MRHYRTNGTRFMKLVTKSLKLIHISNKPSTATVIGFYKNYISEGI